MRELLCVSQLSREEGGEKTIGRRKKNEERGGRCDDDDTIEQPFQLIKSNLRFCCMAALMKCDLFYRMKWNEEKIDPRILYFLFLMNFLALKLCQSCGCVDDDDDDEEKKRYFMTSVISSILRT
jgi:hypothetical protein